MRQIPAKLAVVVVLALTGGIAYGQEGSLTVPSVPPAHVADPARLDVAQRLFYNGRYEEAAALTLEPCVSGPDGLAACELRSSTLLFQIKRAFGEPPDKAKAWASCTVCAELMPAFLAETARGQLLARARLMKDADDEEAFFLLGKLNLNYVWLQLGTLGRKTGWKEYWEARKSLDAVLKKNPGHVRARVARAWIDYIVDTRMPRGTRWVLGGGDKKKGLRVVREAAAGSDADIFARAEAGFALWDMQVREKNLTGAVVTARELAHDFPDNRELVKFLDAHPVAGQTSK
ncbi:MAG TPA: hypothetical protein VI485_16875 [Vicinamibacterales bacterium]|nr:hypothetical protein [Vicinamibacterales bacterium]